MHSKNINDVFKILQTSENGLTQKEAEKRLRQNGKNELAKAKKTSKWILFFSQFADLMIVVLCVAALISGIIGFATKSKSELFDALIVLIIVFLNAIIGFIQEIKAEKSIQSLKKMTETHATALRDGRLVKIPTSDLVVGDVVLLSAGDLVGADIRLFKTYNLKISESVLTGESEATLKTTHTIFGQPPLGDRNNMAFSGGVVENGRGVGVVCAVGMDSELGKIAKAINTAKGDETKLQKQLNKTAKIITAACLFVSALIFIGSLFLKMGILPAFMTAVAIAVAAIPEGLPAVITIIMALGVVRLSKKGAIVKKLRAVESLGCTQIVCSDKTGTLTENKLTVKKEYCLDEEKLFQCAKFCNNAQIDGEEVGDGVEIALLKFLKDKNINFPKFEKIDEKPFDSTRKKMSVVGNINGKSFLFCKGAPDALLLSCSKYIENGRISLLTPAKEAEIKQKIKEFGDEALKVLGFAFKEDDVQSDDEGLVFVGLVGMMDPPRKGVKDAIENCKMAGIKTVMVTGDHKATAFAIAKKLGIASSEEQVLTGVELDKLSSRQLEEKIMDVCVFARVTPEHKLKIVKTFKKLGKVVAMTGDGVNDAPSLKEADIGIGMGKSGTEVAQSVCDIVLANDNFEAIPTSVEEGRKIYSNIKKTIGFLLSANIAEMLSLLIITLFVAPFLGKIVFLLPAQILFVNLITDAVPAIALGIEPAEKNIMKNPPRVEKSHLLMGKTGINIVYQGIAQTVLVLFSFLFGLIKFGNLVGSTMALVTLNVIQLFHAYNCKNETQSLLKSGFRNNKLLFVSFVSGTLLTILVCTVPPLMNVFGVAKLNPVCWFVSLLCAFLIVPIVEIVKYFQRKMKK